MSEHTPPNTHAPLSAEAQQRLRRIDAAALWHPFTQMQNWRDEDPPPPVIVGAEGNWLIDDQGTRYLDANSGYWCMALGCRPAEAEAAVAAQLQRFGHSTLLGLSHRPAIELAARLTELAGPPLNHAFFADSGSEAVEVALKMAYQYQVLNGRPERSKFLALGESYHGDTLGAVSVGGIEVFHATFKPLTFATVRVAPPYCYRCPWGKERASCALECAGAMEQAISAHAHELAAVMIEPQVLGPGGVIPQPEGYLQRVAAAARAHDVPVIFDEVAVGMGRLGHVFTFHEAGVTPDIVCSAKGLTAGILPLSATIVHDRIYDTFLGAFGERRQFYHGHTFTGSALGCAAALAALEVLTRPGFLEHVRGTLIPAFHETLAPLKRHGIVGEVRGRGMMAGIELVADREAKSNFGYAERMGHRVVLECRRRGVQTRAIGDIVLAVPPLTLTLDELKLLGRVLDESIGCVKRKT